MSHRGYNIYWGYLANYAPLDRLGEIYGGAALIKPHFSADTLLTCVRGLICYIIFMSASWFCILSSLYVQFGSTSTKETGTKHGKEKLY